MSLTLDEYLILLLLDGVVNFYQVKQIIGDWRDAISQAIFCRYSQIKARFDHGMTYIDGTPGGRSGHDKVLTNDEWFVLLLLYVAKGQGAAYVLQRLPKPIAFCQVAYDRLMDIFTRYERGWRAGADPSIAASA